MTPAAAAALEPLVARPAQAGVFTDFDGTLSEIVDEPSAASPLDGVPQVLGDLAGRFGRVAVLSGRPVSFLMPLFPPAVLIAGLYGLERVEDGVKRDHPMGGAWREVVDDVASVSQARGPAGMRVESKGLSLTLHYRGRPELEPEVRAWAEHQAARSGLEVRSARMSIELHPPIPIDKGTALLDLAGGLEAVCYLGDDLGDLAAFDALDELAGQGVYALRVGVRSTEHTEALLERADLVVDGPLGSLELIEHLRDRTA